MSADWFNANKVTFGGLLTIVGTVLAGQATDTPSLLIWSQLCLAVGPFLAGGGMLKPDSHYKPYDGPERRRTNTPEGVVSVKDDDK
jgi:hypothetical protein